MGIGPLLLCVLLIVVLWWGPGWILGEALGVRRVLLPVVAPLLGMGVLTVIGVMGNALGLSWQLLPVTAVLLVLSALLFAVRIALRRYFPDLRSGRGVVLRHSPVRGPGRSSCGVAAGT